MSIADSWVAETDQWRSLRTGNVKTFPGSGTAAARLGLHVTDDELAIWRDRAVNGPFAVAGDFKAGSPGDWTRIVGNKNDAAMSGFYNPSSSPTPGIVWHSTNSDAIDGATRIRDAAFWHLVRHPSEDTSATANLCRDWLLEQAGYASVDWSDRSLWELEYYWDNNPSFEICEWLAVIAHAFDYLRASERDGYTVFTEAQRDTLRLWLYNAADYWQHDWNDDAERNVGGMERYTADPDWPDRNMGTAPNTSVAFMYPDGTTQTIGGIHTKINNRQAQISRLAATVGAILHADGYPTPSGASPGRSVTFLFECGLYWSREVLAYGASPRGFFGDYNRWTATDPVQGWAYSSSVMASTVQMADMAARLGDWRAYDYATRWGLHGTECLTGDPDKTVGWLVEQHCRYVAEELEHYGTDDTGNRTYAYQIKSHTTVDGTKWRIRDLGAAVTNLHLKSELLRRCAERDPGGDWPNIPDGYPTSDLVDADFGWMSEGKIMPGVLLMFAHPGTAMSEWPNPYPEAT